MRGMDDPRIATDLAEADALSKAFEADYKGKLADIAAAPEAARSSAPP